MNRLIDGYYHEAELAKGFTHFVEIIKIPEWQLQDSRIKQQVSRLAQQTSTFLLSDFVFYPIPLLSFRSQFCIDLLRFPPTHRIQVGLFRQLKTKNKSSAGQKRLIFEITVSLAEVSDRANYASDIGGFLLNNLSNCKTRFGLQPSSENAEWFLLCFFSSYAALRRRVAVPELG